MKLLQKKDKFAILINGKSNKPAGIAQLVEQRTENPRVTSSSLVPGITHETPSRQRFWGFFNAAKTPFQRFEGCRLGVNLPPRWTFLDGFGQFIGVKLG